MKKKKETNFSLRLTLYWIFQCLFLLVLVVRLFDLQILDRSNLKEQALKQFKAEISLPAERGSIVDRNYKILAMNMPAVDVVADPSEIKNGDKIITELVRLSGKPYSYFHHKLKEKSSFVYLLRRQPPEIKEKIEKLNLEGISFQSNMLRKYPKERVGCQVIGFTDVDNHGLSGIELALDAQLRGTPGKAVLQKTATAVEFVRAEYPVVPPKNGMDVVLTIDYRYQRIAEFELRKTIVESDADSGIVVIMNPRNGEILALAGEPSFDPNRAGSFQASSWRLRGVTDQYEPGSTFKVVLMSALLDEKLHSPDDSVFCENGEWEVYGESIKDTHPYGWLTLRDVLVKSSNIGMAKLAKETDPGIFYDYAHAFGFGTRPGTELVGETAGVLKLPKEWSGTTPLAMAFGHEIAASALQMCNLYATIANGGILYQPRIIREIRNNGGVVKAYSARSIRRVIKPETADTLKSFLREAVVRGTGKKAEIPGFDICGKTGTAKVALSGGRGYSNRYNASFGGFFPMDDPQIAMFIMINNPKRKYYGGEVAAPCFKRIAEQIVAIDGLDINVQDSTPQLDDLLEANGIEPSVPSLRGYSTWSAKQIANNEGLEVTVKGAPGLVTGQRLKDKKELELIAEAVDILSQGSLIVPNVEGLPLRNAMNLLRARGFSPSISGHGKVIRQSPRAGQKVTSKQIKLVCESLSRLKSVAM